jgi:hypothetical protein
MTDLESLRAEVEQVRLALIAATDKRERERLQKTLRYMERELLLRSIWLEMGVRCPCCQRLGMIHAHRATCVICGKGFQYDPFKDSEHMPSHPGLVAGYWKGRPKTFFDQYILKGDTEDNGKRKRREQGSLGFIQ